MVNNFYNDKDSTDISELAALNEDISDDMIEQLSQQLSQNIGGGDITLPPVNENDDSTLFEETQIAEPATSEPDTAIAPEPAFEEASAAIETPIEEPKIEDTPAKKEEVQVNKSFDDNFIKKYKAKLNKKAQAALQSGKSVSGEAPTKYMQEQAEEEPIEKLSDGNISERPLTQEAKDYNESLDFLDGNIKYSKYVIYIDPKNVDFIDGLTVKERKNLINNILRQQDDISITKQRFALLQTIIRQVIIAILTVAISIPLIYFVINASLEATVDNYRRSQINWQALYKQHGKIQSLKQY